MMTVTARPQDWNQLLATAQQHNVAEAFQAFRARGIEPVLIKGWAAARNYPKGTVRRPGDVDLVVSPSDYSEAVKVYQTPDFAKYNIDLHNGLWPLDVLTWEDLVARSQLVDLNGEKIRILCDEDHLRILCTHWLIDGGGYKDKLWDIYYAVENRGQQFDWDRCLNASGPIRRDWVHCCLSITSRYLGLDVSNLPIASEIKPLPRWIDKCLQREWKNSHRLEPILTSTHDRRLLLNQIVRRLPPNPIRATIEAEGDLYGNRRLIYQMAVLKRRALPFFRHLVGYMRMRLTKNPA